MSVKCGSRPLEPLHVIKEKLMILIYHCLPVYGLQIEFLHKQL